MAGWCLSEQARQAVRAARALARAGEHTVLGPPHLLAAILQQWDDQPAGGPALLRACGLTAEQATTLTAELVHAYDAPEAATPTAEPRPNPSIRFILAHARRIAAEGRAPTWAPSTWSSPCSGWTPPTSCASRGSATPGRPSS
jgi:hypothetical protein